MWRVFIITLVNADQHPHKESLVAKTSAFRQFFVKLWICDCYVRTDVLIEYQREYREHGVESGVSNH